MNEPSKLPDTAVASISCPCHSVLKYRGEAGDCLGAVRFQYPTSMFDPAGTLQYRLHRSQFLQQMAQEYDERAELVRQELNKMDPTTVRPPLERLGMAVIDTTAVAKALAPDDATEEPIEEPKGNA